MRIQYRDMYFHPWLNLNWYKSCSAVRNLLTHTKYKEMSSCEMRVSYTNPNEDESNLPLNNRCSQKQF